ncbi:MAG: hypothetical protein AB7N76_33980 [Planctomycetota bacterium]
MSAAEPAHPVDPGAAGPPPAPPWLGRLFALAALGFAIAGLSHVVRGVAWDPADTSSRGRHALFVLINALAIAGVLRRPRWILAPFLLLTLQQLHTHGGRALLALQAGQPPRFDDVAVALGMPLIVALLVYDLRRQST